MITLELPDMAVPGTGGNFELAGGEVTLFVRGNGEFYITGRVEFSLPNLDLGGGGSSMTQVTYLPENVDINAEPDSVSIKAEFELDQDGLNYVMISGEADPGVPIGQTGLALTGLEGRVDIADPITVQLTGTIQSQIEVPPLGPLISGSPSLWFSFGSDYGIGVSGNLNVLIFEAARASLSLSQSRGLEGSVEITYPPPIPLYGGANIHVWCGQWGSWGCDEIHFTGSASVTIGLKKGAWWSKCLNLFVGKVCINIPPASYDAATAECQIGEFCVDGNCGDTVYGLKGRVSLFDGWWEETIFFDTSRNFAWGDDTDEYDLYEQPGNSLQQVAAGFLTAPYTDTRSVAVGATDQALFALAWMQGDPAFALVDPIGHRLMPGVDPSVYYTEVITSAFYIVNQPISGSWQVQIGNLNGDEGFLLNVLGSNVPPTVTVESVTPLNATSYTVQWAAQDPDDTPTLALYYDNDNAGVDGMLIAEGLSPASGSYTWDASTVQTGEYYVYARIDDLKNLPVVSYYTNTVTVVNSQPPAMPTGVQITVNASRTGMRVCWSRNSEADVVGYNVYFGTLTGVYDLGVYNANNVTCQNLPVPPWLDTGYVGVSAYDNSGNESLLTEVPVTIDRVIRVYLPLALR
jgi:hypothetical protein